MRKFGLSLSLIALSVCGAGWPRDEVQKVPALWPVHIESMEYPFLAASGSLEGSIVVRCELDTAGGVTEAKTQGPGPEDLATASERNARQWRFAVPDQGNGPFTVYVQYEYRLTPTSRPYNPATTYSVDLPHRVLVTTQKPPMHVFHVR